ncbi:MAG: M14 family zinc carboxypeptidase, partial [Pseudonocardiaceae bacterium]
MSYFNVNEVESALTGLAAAYPSICELIFLPNLTIEGRTCHAVRIGKYAASDRDAVLLTGVVHARE